LSEDSPQKSTRRGSFSRAWAKLRSGSSKRRVLALLGVLAIVLVLVVIPMYMALQPKYVSRFPDLKRPYETWTTSVHAQASCQSCHVSPRITSQSAYATKMLGIFYLAILKATPGPEMASPANDACLKCHVDLRTVSPSGDLNIPHRAHVTVLKLKCVQCHNYLVHDTNAEGKHTPRMAECMTCHNGKKAKNNCSACHTEKALPENHKSPEWIIVHPNKQQETDCAKCHKWTEKWCAQCHSTRPRSHGATWRADHGAAVKKRRNCESCHEAAFCIKCHGVLPTENLNPNAKVVQ